MYVYILYRMDTYYITYYFIILVQIKGQQQQVFHRAPPSLYFGKFGCLVDE